MAEDLGPADVAEHGNELAGIALAGGGVDRARRDRRSVAGHPDGRAAGPDLLEVADGSGIVVDGAEGTVVLDPAGARSELAGAATANARERAREESADSAPARSYRRRAPGRGARERRNAGGDPCGP